VEKIEADGKKFHKTCFKCELCKKVLSLTDFAAQSGKIYCKPHFKQLQLKAEDTEKVRPRATSNPRVDEFKSGTSKLQKVDGLCSPTFSGSFVMWFSLRFLLLLCSNLKQILHGFYEKAQEHRRCD